MLTLAMPVSIVKQKEGPNSGLSRHAAGTMSRWRHSARTPSSCCSALSSSQCVCRTKSSTCGQDVGAQTVMRCCSALGALQLQHKFVDLTASQHPLSAGKPSLQAAGASGWAARSAFESCPAATTRWSAQYRSHAAAAAAPPPSTAAGLAERCCAAHAQFHARATHAAQHSSPRRISQRGRSPAASAPCYSPRTTGGRRKNPWRSRGPRLAARAEGTLLTGALQSSSPAPPRIRPSGP